MVITAWSAPSRNSRETARPHAAAASARRRLSVSSCRMMRRRDAPSDSRMPISRWRETPRASSRLATLAQPIARISPKAKNSGEKTRAHPSLDSVPWRGVSETWIGCPGPARLRAKRAARAKAAIGSSRCPRREGGCRRLGRQPRFQPPDDLDGDLVFSSCSGVAELPGERKWRPIVGRSDAEAPKAVGHDADDLVRRAVGHHAAADHRPIAPEQLAPSRVTQHDHRPAGKPLVVSRHQRAPERGLDPQHLEEVPADEDCNRGTALDARQGRVAASRRHQ